MTRTLAAALALSALAAFSDTEPAITNRLGSLSPNSVVVLPAGYFGLKDLVATNKALAASELNDHVTNTERHVTARERSTWNAKQSALTAGEDYVTPMQMSNRLVFVDEDIVSVTNRLKLIEASTNYWAQKQQPLVAGTDYAVPNEWTGEVARVKASIGPVSNDVAAVLALTNSWSAKQDALVAGTDYATPGQVSAVSNAVNVSYDTLTNRIRAIEAQEAVWNGKQNTLQAGVDYAMPSQIDATVGPITADVQTIRVRVAGIETQTNYWASKQDALTADEDYVTPGTLESTVQTINSTVTPIGTRVTGLEAKTNYWNAKQDALVAGVDYATTAQVETVRSTLAGVDTGLAGRLTLIEGQTNYWASKQNELIPGTDYITPDNARNIIAPIVNSRLSDFVDRSNLTEMVTDVVTNRTTGYSEWTLGAVADMGEASITNVAVRWNGTNWQIRLEGSLTGIPSTNFWYDAVVNDYSYNWAEPFTNIAKSVSATNITVLIHAEDSVNFSMNEAQALVTTRTLLPEHNALDLVFTEDLAKATPGDYANVSNRAYAAARADTIVDDYPADIDLAGMTYIASAKMVRDKIAGATPGDYYNVSNKAYGAIQSGSASYLSGAMVAGGNSITLTYGDGTEVDFTPSAPVSSVNGLTGAVSLDLIPGASSTSANTQWDTLLYGRTFDWRVTEGKDIAFDFILADDLFIRGWVDGDANVFSLTNKMAQVISSVSVKVPNTRTVNGKPLSADVNLTLNDIPVDTQATNTIRSVANTIYDPGLTVTWSLVASNGCFYAIAVTNVNLHAGN